MMFSMFKLILYLSVLLIESGNIMLTSSEFPPLFESTLTYLVESLEWESNESINQANVLPEYDFIVVGAGSAGSVVASRLSEVNQTISFIINYSYSLYSIFVFFFQTK